MTLVEKRLIILFISKINNDPKEPERVDPLKVYKIKVEEFAALYGLDLETAKDELAEGVEKLFQQELSKYVPL